jgi:hypothetical protein
MGVTVKDTDLGYKNIIKGLKGLKKAYTKVGLFGNTGDASNNMAERAAIMEFGTRNGNIPERPFMRQTFKREKDNIVKIMSKNYVKFLDSKGLMNKANILKKVGQWYTGELKDGITKGTFQSLDPATIKAKGSSQPLIDTGDMRRAINHKEVLK